MWLVRDAGENANRMAGSPRCSHAVPSAHGTSRMLPFARHPRFACFCLPGARWLRIAGQVALGALCILAALVAPLQEAHGASYTSTSADPYERAAAQLDEALQKIAAKLLTASMSDNPDQDRDLVDAVAGALMTHHQLADNAHLHSIPPPDLSRIRAACAALADRQRDEIDRLQQAIKEVEQELKEAKALRQTLTNKIKGNLALNLTGLSIEAMTRAVTIIGGAPSMGLSQIASGVNELVLDFILPQTPGIKIPAGDPKAAISLQTQSTRVRQLYNAHKAEIDQRVATWIHDTYFTSAKQGQPLHSAEEYLHLIQKDAEKRAALQRRFLEELRQLLMREVIPGREDLLKQQRAQLQSLQGTAANPADRSYFPRYKAICATILGLKPWQVAPPSTPAVIGFGQAEYQVSESAGSVTVQVLRSGNADGAVAVTVTNADGTARAPEDYGAVNVVINWADGQAAAASIVIPVTDDGLREGREYFSVHLGNPSGSARLGPNATAKVWIDDVTAPRDAPGAGDEPPVRPRECRYLRITPDGIEVGAGRQTLFRAIAVYTDASEEDVTARATWQPGPGNVFTVPADLRFNQRVTVTAHLDACEGRATVNALAPSWSPPMSHADDLGARGEQPGPADYTWFAVCRTADGEVLYAENPDRTQFRVMQGPFPGPRNAEAWINQNCPRWRCTTSGACATDPAYSPMPGWSVVCDKRDLRIYTTREVDLARHWVLQERLLGAPEADLWVQRHCAARICVQGGSCAPAGQARTGGKWAVACSKSGGGVVLTEYPDRVNQWIWAENLFAEIDARAWADQKCPSWRCDRDGRCLPGNRPIENTTSGQPIEVPPGDVLALFGQREASRQASRAAGTSSTSGTDASVPATDGFGSQSLQQAMRDAGIAAGAGSRTPHPDGRHDDGVGTTGGDGTGPSVVTPPVVPPPATTTTDAPAWYGIEVKVDYEQTGAGGRRCTLTDHYEGQVRPSQLPSLDNEARNKARGWIVGAMDRRITNTTTRVYAGPQATKPTYPGKAGAQCQ